MKHRKHLTRIARQVVSGPSAWVQSLAPPKRVGKQRPRSRGKKKQRLKWEET